MNRRDFLGTAAALLVPASSRAVPDKAQVTRYHGRLESDGAYIMAREMLKDAEGGPIVERRREKDADGWMVHYAAGESLHYARPVAYGPDRFAAEVLKVVGNHRSGQALHIEVRPGEEEAAAAQVLAAGLREFGATMHGRPSFPGVRLAEYYSRPGTPHAYVVFRNAVSWVSSHMLVRRHHHRLRGIM